MKLLKPHRLFLTLRSGLAVGTTVAIMLAGAAHAQGVGLQALMELAVRQHPTVLQAKSQLDVSGFNLETAQWGRFPSLATELRSDTDEAQSIVRIEQPLWAGGRINGQIKRASSDLKMAQASYKETQLNVLLQVSGAFFEALRLQARLQAANINVNDHQNLLALIGRRVDSEVSPVVDATLAQSRLQSALNERVQIDRQLQATLSALSQWAGPVAQQLIKPSHIPFSWQTPVEAWIQQAYAQSPARERLLETIQNSNIQADLAKSSAYPTVMLGYQHIVAGPMAVGADKGRAYVGLQYQTGAGLSVWSGVKSALAKKEASEHELQVLERSLRSQIETLSSEIVGLNAQQDSAGQLVLGTGELLDSYLRQYQIGRKNWLDVLNALREKTQAAYTLADVQFTLQSSQVKLMLLVGEISVDRPSIPQEAS